MRCKPKWQNEQGIWRRGHVWVREHADAIEEEAGQPRRNNLVGRLLAIVTVHDPERRDEDGEPQRYSEAFIDILRHRNKGRPHDVHGLIEVEPIPVTAIVRRGVRVRPNRSVPNWGSQLAVLVPVPCGGG